MPTPNLTDKIVIITGAAGGFGRVLVRAFLDRGARVAALDIDQEGLSRLERELSRAHKGALMTSVTDIADYAACEKAVTRTVRELSGLDVLINNGAMGMGAIRADHLVRPVPIDEVTPEVWQRMVAVNFSGAWHMTRAAVPHCWHAAGGGSSISPPASSPCCAAAFIPTARARPRSRRCRRDMRRSSGAGA